MLQRHRGYAAYHLDTLAEPARGRPARLDDAQLQALGRTLLHGPTAHGFGTESWATFAPLGLSPGSKSLALSWRSVLEGSTAVSNGMDAAMEAAQFDAMT